MAVIHDHPKEGAISSRKCHPRKDCPGEWAQQSTDNVNFCTRSRPYQLELFGPFAGPWVWYQKLFLFLSFFVSLPSPRGAVPKTSNRRINRFVFFAGLLAGPKLAGLSPAKWPAKSPAKKKLPSTSPNSHSRIPPWTGRKRSLRLDFSSLQANFLRGSSLGMLRGWAPQALAPQEALQKEPSGLLLDCLVLVTERAAKSRSLILDTCDLRTDHELPNTCSLSEPQPSSCVSQSEMLLLRASESELMWESIRFGPVRNDRAESFRSCPWLLSLVAHASQKTLGSSIWTPFHHRLYKTYGEAQCFQDTHEELPSSQYQWYMRRLLCPPSVSRRMKASATLGRLLGDSPYRAPQDKGN